MESNRYKLTESIGKFKQGDVLEVVSEYGDWHRSDFKLQRPGSSSYGSIEVSEDELEKKALKLAEPLEP